MALSNRVPDMREPEPKKPGRPVSGLIWSLLALAVLIAIIVWVFKAPNRSNQAGGPTGAATQVKFSNLKVQNGFVEGTAQNLSPEPLTAIYVTAGFTNNAGHVVQTEPETVENAAGSSLASDPIPSGESHDIRISLKNPPQNWDGTTPQLTITGVDHGAAGAAGGQLPNTGAGAANGSGMSQTGQGANGANTATTPGGNAAGGAANTGAQGGNGATQSPQQSTTNPR